MKYLILSISLLLTGVFNLFAQEQHIDSLHRPRNFHIKVDQFSRYANSSQDVIFLGNSITAGTNWNELLQIANARNRGISGDTTFGILERLDEVTEGKPAKIFILIGINDIARNYPDSVVIENYHKIVKKIKKATPKTKIYIQSILPVNNTFTQYKNHYNKDEHIIAVNKGIKEIAKIELVSFIDIHPCFLDAEQRLDEQFTEEGLHLNAVAYLTWAKILMPYLNDEKF